MISLLDHNLSTIRDFSREHFEAHVDQIKAIAEYNKFGSFGIHEILDHYIKLSDSILEKNEKEGQEEFPLSKEEAVLYDLIIEIVRLCYKYSYETSADHNDWENEF
ncbi:MAG: hypothetical protein ACRCS8_03050 [Brevinema sp.]